MARPTKNIPFDDIKGLRTLVKEEATRQEMADYYDVSLSTIGLRLKEVKKDVRGRF